jgi:hypothetical protein
VLTEFVLCEAKMFCWRQDYKQTDKIVFNLITGEQISCSSRSFIRILTNDKIDQFKSLLSSLEIRNLGISNYNFQCETLGSWVGHLGVMKWLIIKLA